MYTLIWISNIRLIWIDFQVSVFSLFKDIEGNRNSFKKKKKKLKNINWLSSKTIKCSKCEWDTDK